MLKEPHGGERLAWLLAAAWLALIYASIPVARGIQHFVEAHLDRALFLAATLVLLLLAGSWALRLMLRRESRPSAGQWLWLGGCAIAYVRLAWSLRQNPEESLHVIEYGVLGLLLFRALSHRYRDSAVYLVAGFAGLLAGTVDELIQWIVPDRFFDYRDVLVNGMAACLAQLVVALGFRPDYIRPTWSSGTFAVALRLTAVTLLFFAASALATPARLNQWVTRHPSLAFLDQAMMEYGLRFEDPDGIVFYSRLTAAGLQQQDRERGPQAARILDHFRDREGYRRFGNAYPPWRDAFVHEARVHLFRRDIYLQLAGRHRANPNRFRDDLTIGWFENRILEKYFGNTLAHSTYQLTAEQRSLAEAAVAPGARYESSVSSGLVTRWTERQLQGLLLAGLLVVLAAERYCSRSNKAVS